MSIFRARILPAALLLAASAVVAAPNDPPVSVARAGVRGMDAVEVWSMPPVDRAALIREDEANEGIPGLPLRIGFPVASDLVADRSGTWEELSGGDRLWRLRLKSPEALWMVLGFDAFHLQDGGKLWIYDSEKKTVLGPFGATDIRDHGELWTPPIEGDELIVELYWPARLRNERPRMHLGTVSHGYKPFGTIGRDRYEKAFGDSGSCNIDVACPLGNDWQDEKRGAVILLSGGSGFCSGSMINNTGNTGSICKPYVLTAAHCSAGASTTFGFNFERPGCNSGTPSAPSTFTVTGATVRGNFASSDFTLLEMSALPPQSFNFYLNGWNRDPNPTTATWVIHHPSGDAKKISRDGDPPVNGSNWGTNHWRIDDSSADPLHRGYEEGTTEGGSSGSPLFNPAGQIIGQLHGGTASCSSDTYDEFGKVAASWTGGGTAASRLSDWLDPLATGALSQGGKNSAACFFLAAGEVSVNRTNYSCSDTVAITVHDDNLQGQATQAVTITSTTEASPETVVLNAIAPNSGTFTGTINVASGPVVPGNGILSVANGDTITVTYIDADDGAGGTNVTRTATATADCAAPVISNVQSSLVTGNSARITWTTNEASNSTVAYGTTIPPVSSASNPAQVTSHVVDLTGLPACSFHNYSVGSADAAGNAATDTNGGAYYSFTTGQNVNPSFTSTDTPINIPDNNPTGITSTINVADTKQVLDVNVTANITHTFDGDLILSLIGPNNVTVVLSNRRGSSGQNFVNTVFDDEAATAISAGAAPFTGSFRPESPLTVFDGIQSNGAWRLKVVDAAGQDVGPLNNWTLTLTYPSQACGPHAKYESNANVTDVCASGGAGGNNVWDAGETVSFSVKVGNDGSIPLTGISATVTPVTAGVVMLNGTQSFADLAAGAQGDSNAPHFTATLPVGLSCASNVDFNVVINTAQGSWNGSFSHVCGQVISGGGTVLNEAFTSGIPATWTIVDGGVNTGLSNTWQVTNPEARPIASPMAAPVANVDSDNAGTGGTQDEQLLTPVLDLTVATGVTLEFDQFFRWYVNGLNEVADVDIRSVHTGGAWVNVLRQQGASSPEPDHKTINITAQAAGAADVQIRFHYYSGQFEWYWQLDNVKVTYTAPGGCNMTTCSAAPAAPPPVPDGTFGTAMKGSRAAADGSVINLTWDVSACTGADYHALYGSLSTVASYAVSGGACNLGTSGAQTWSSVPGGNLWFVVVSDDDLATEGSWGKNSAGAERSGGTASGVCSIATRNNTGTCP